VESIFKRIGDFARAHIIGWTVGIFLIAGLLGNLGMAKYIEACI
jgi:hypothetical protein